VAILLRRVLHPELLSYVDFHSIRPAPTAHSNARLGTRHGDLRSVVDLRFEGRPIALHLAIEHQSTLEPRFPWRAHVYVGDVWSGYIQGHPGPPHTLPFVLPILLTQHPARNTPRRISDILDMPRRLPRWLGTPFELELCIDYFSGSVLDDEAAPRRTRAFVELARAFLHTYQNIDSLTESRMTTLADQVDILLEPSEPGVESSGRDEIDALWTYVITVFETGSVRERILSALSPPARETYMTMEEDLLARGEQRGLSWGRAEGLSRGRAEGLSKGRALAVLDLLELRALPIPARVRLRVLATRDESLLCRWLARALTVASAEELFESGGK
jgi:hypothetical protein